MNFVKYFCKNAFFKNCIRQYIPVNNKVLHYYCLLANIYLQKTDGQMDWRLGIRDCFSFCELSSVNGNLI